MTLAISAIYGVDMLGYQMLGDQGFCCFQTLSGIYNINYEQRSCPDPLPWDTAEDKMKN